MDALHLELEPPVALHAPLRVVAQPSLFRELSSRITKTVPHGATLLELVLETGMGELREGVVHLPGKVVCTIDGNPIERQYWHLVRPAHGRLVNIFLVPQDQRTMLIVGISLAIGVGAIFTGGLLAGAGYPILGAVLAGGIAMGGNYALTALVPMQEDNSGVTSQKARGSAVTGDSNPLEKDGLVPVVLANAVRVVPRHWARPFTEAAGDDTYWRMLLVFGQGPLAIDEDTLKAGDTLLSANPDAYEYEVREGRASEPPLTLFTKDVFEVNPADTLGELKGGESNAQVQTTQPGTVEISLDVVWPQGLFHQGKVDVSNYTVEFTLEIRTAGAGAWTDFVTGGGVQKRHETEDNRDFKRLSFRRQNLGGRRLRRPRNPQDVDLGQQSFGDVLDEPAGLPTQRPQAGQDAGVRRDPGEEDRLRHGAGDLRDLWDLRPGVERDRLGRGCDGQPGILGPAPDPSHRGRPGRGIQPEPGPGFTDGPAGLGGLVRFLRGSRFRVQRRVRRRGHGA